MSKLMSMMELQIVRKGALYLCDCAKCGCTLYSHEFVHDDHNERRDAMENGTLRCDNCGGSVDKESYCRATRPHYAARYSAPGYLDCTEWEYGPNKRTLERHMRWMHLGE